MRRSKLPFTTTLGFLFLFTFALTIPVSLIAVSFPDCSSISRLAKGAFHASVQAGKAGLKAIQKANGSPTALIAKEYVSQGIRQSLVMASGRRPDPLENFLTQITDEQMKASLVRHINPQNYTIPEPKFPAWYWSPISHALYRASLGWSRSEDPEIGGKLVRLSKSEGHRIVRDEFKELAWQVYRTPHFTRGVLNMTRGLKPEQARAVLADYFRDPSLALEKRRAAEASGDLAKKEEADSELRSIEKRLTSAIMVFRALGQMGMTPQAFEKVSEDMLTNRGQLRKDGGIDEFSAAVGPALGSRMPRGRTGAAILHDVTPRMDNGISGSIFHNFMKAKYFTPEGLYTGSFLERLGLFSFRSKKKATGRIIYKVPVRLRDRYQGKESVESDESVDDGDTYRIVEFKHYQTGDKFTEEINQIKNYRALYDSKTLLTPSIASAGDKPIGKVQYVFSKRAAAEANVGVIRNILGEIAIVSYIDYFGRLRNLDP